MGAAPEVSGRVGLQPLCPRIHSRQAAAEAELRVIRTRIGDAIAVVPRE